MIVSSVGTVTSTSSNAINLLNYAMSFESFSGSEYVIFSDADYSYYIVWGDLKKEDSSVVGGEIEYIHYYRTTSSGYTSSYTYTYGTDTEFELTLSTEYIPTSNISEVGFVSSISQEYELYQNVLWFLVFLVAMIFAIMIKVLRGSKS